MWNVVVRFVVVSLAVLPQLALAEKSPRRCPALTGKIEKNVFRIPRHAAVGTVNMKLGREVALGFWDSRRFVIQVGSQTFSYAIAPEGKHPTPTLRWVGNSSILVQSEFAPDALIDANARRVIVDAEEGMRFLDCTVDGQFFAFSARGNRQLVLVNETWQRSFAYLAPIYRATFLTNAHGATELVVQEGQALTCQSFKLSDKGFDPESNGQLVRPAAEWFPEVPTFATRVAQREVLTAQSADGKYIAYAAKDGEISVRNLQSGRGKVLEQANDGNVTDLHFERDGSLHAFRADRGTITVWELP